MSKEKTKHAFKGATHATRLQALKTLMVRVAPLVFYSGCYKGATGCYKNSLQQLTACFIEL